MNWPLQAFACKLKIQVMTNEIPSSSLRKNIDVCKTTLIKDQKNNLTLGNISHLQFGVGHH
jgi:hypothetical protein